MSTNTTQLFLVRHADTTMLSDNKINGQSDSPLSEAGLRDSQKTADYFHGQNFDAFYASSLGRAMHTAEIIGKSIKKDPTPDDRLMERYFGHLEGKQLNLFSPDGNGVWLFRPYVNLVLALTGESEKKFINRIIESIQEITAEHQGGRILVVTHWLALSIIAQFLQGNNMKGWRDVGPWTACGISEFQSNGSNWKVVRLNEDRHLK